MNDIPSTWKMVLDASAALEAEGRLLDAIAALESSTALHWRRPEIYAALGRLAAKAGRFVLAELALRRALDLKPGHWPTLKGLIDVFDTMQLSGEAIDLLQGAVKSDPGNLVLQLNLGLAELRLKQYARAAAALQVVVASDPSHRQAKLLLTIALEKLGRKPEAASPEVPGLPAGGDGVALMRMAKLERLARNHGMAEALLRRGMDLLPQDHVPAMQLAEMLAETGNLDAAALVLEDAIRRMPKSVELYWCFSRLLRSKDEAAANALAEKVLELEPGHAQAASIVSQAQSKARNRDGALSTLLRAAEANPKDIGLQYRLGLTLQNNTHYPAAALAFRKVLATDPVHAGSLRQLAIGLRRQGKLEEAAASFAETESIIRGTLPATFVEGMIAIERSSGIERAVSEKRLSQGLLPDRQGWSTDQRFSWSRRVISHINNWYYFNRHRHAEVAPFIDGPDWQAIAAESPPGKGALMVGSHFGLSYLSLFQLAVSGLPYMVVARTDEILMSFGKNAMDVFAKDNHTALAKLGSLIKNGTFVFSAGDGGAGQRGGQLAHRGYRANLAIGPAVLTAFARAPVYFFQAVFDGPRIRIITQKGPDAQARMPFEEWSKQWFAFYTDELRKVLDSGPENLIESVLTAYRKSGYL